MIQTKPKGRIHGSRRARELSFEGNSKQPQKVIIQRKEEDRRFGTIVILILLVASASIISPALGQNGPSITQKTTDYGIFNKIQLLHEEQASRENDPQVMEDVDSTLGSMDISEHTFSDPGSAGFTEESVQVSEPITKSPIIFDALRNNPIINNTNVLEWILPPPLSEQGAVNYLVMVKHDQNEVWGLGSMVPRVGITVDSSLDKWVYLDIDNNPVTGDGDGYDLRARMTFAKDLLARDWDVTLIPPSLSFHNAGARIEVEALETTNGLSDLGGSIYFIKGISYGGITGEGKNYIWSVGFEMVNFMDTMKVFLEASEWRSDPVTGIINAIMSGGGVDFRDLGLLEVFGPFTLTYQFGTAPRGVSIAISVMRVFDQVLQDRAYLKLELKNDKFHDTIIRAGSLILNIPDFGSPIDRLEWVAAGGNVSQDDTIHLGLKYVEFGDDLVDGDIQIPILPHRLTLDISYGEDGGQDKTIVDISTPSGIDHLTFLEVIYPKWGTTGSTEDWNATSLELKNIPRRIRIETTANVPPPDEGAGGILNAFDNFMSQIAGRFYRIGNVLREIPRAVAEMPSRQGSTKLDCYGDSIGSLDYQFTSGAYLNGTGNWIAFYDHGGERPAISAHLEGIRSYEGSFNNGSDIKLGLDDVESIRIVAIFQDRMAIVDISDIPSEIHLKTSEDLISYEGMDNGVGARIGAVEYRYRDQHLYFDVNIYDIPSSLTMVRGNDQVDIESGSGAIGEIEVFTANSTQVRPIDLVERNFISVNKENELSGVGLRLYKFRSFTYNNGTAGFIELETTEESNFYAVIRDQDSGLEIDAAFIPLPSKTRIDVPSVIEAPQIQVPNLIGIQDISEYSDILLSLSEIGKAPLVLAAGISEGITNAIGKYSTGFSMAWDLTEQGDTLDLILTIRKEGDFEIPDAKWTHGIWMEQKGLGEESSVNGNIYLNGMPTSGEVNLSFGEETISAMLDFKGFSPEFDWLLIQTNGVQDRDMMIYITGLEEEMDILLDMEMKTDLAIGGQMVIDMVVELYDAEGNPTDLGPTIANLRRVSPILTNMQMFLPKIPSLFDLTANVGDGVFADYSASDRIDHLYFKVTKYLDEMWSQIYAIFHDVPSSFSVELAPNREFTVQKPFPLQGLPLIDLKTSDDEMDMFIEYDGTGFGQRGRYKIFVDNAGNTSTQYQDDDYIIDSDGIGFLSIEIGRLPVLESFTLSSLSLLGSDIEHLRLEAKMGFGIYPVITITEARGGSFQIKVSGDASLGENEFSPSIYFITLRTRNILGMDLITGVSVNKDTSVVDMGRSDGAKTLPAPLLTLWSWLLGGGG